MLCHYKPTVTDARRAAASPLGVNWSGQGKREIDVELVHALIWVVVAWVINT